MLLKTSFLLPHLLCNVEFEFSWFLNTKQSLFSESLVATEMKKTEAVINKSVYLGLSTLNISKIGIYEFWHDHVKLK